MHAVPLLYSPWRLPQKVTETILAGKVKVMVTASGGFDNLWEEGSYEFGNKATSNSETELAMGHPVMTQAK
jgi:hypothetical protein